MSLIIILVILMVLLIIGAPVMFAVGVAGFSYFIIAPNMWGSVGIYAHKFFTGMDSFVFLCIPLFTLAGDLMGQSGMMNHLVKFSQLLVGRIRGGLAYVNVLVSMLFGGISGSAMADVSALGPVIIEMMKKDGYKTEFAAAITATSAIQGPIIPPSIPMVIFASVTNVSVGALFLGGAIPGVLIGIGQMLMIALMARRRQFPRHYQQVSVQEATKVTASAFWALLMPVIILGGILGGIFTATEAAAVAVGYAFFIATFVYKNMTFNGFMASLTRSVKTTASVYLIIAFSYVLGWIFAVERVPQMIAQFVQAYDLSPYMVLFLINLFILFNGMWISDSVQLILFAPIFTPLVVAMGIHPIHFGVVMVINVMIGLITPPYGFAFYLAATISNTKLKAVVKESLPFLIISIIVLFIVTYIPIISLYLPKLMGLIK
ncbi:MAG: hypothetical protein A2097_07250 [Desulfobacula sp. GWF2_41_7]|nr:MAG: hypothetical protein A2097_07250 [Desulfobacula sp. GWF2_41_7]